MEVGWWRKPKIFKEKIFNKNYNMTDTEKKGILNSVCISDFNLKIIIPRYIDITQEYGYIISQSYGKDLNQYYYENENNHFGEKFRKVYQEVKKILTNNYNYNGFIPRNLIVNKKDLFLIDFEDLNNKPTSVIETTQIIAWSYIINLDIKELLKNDTINTSLDLDNDLQNLLVNYPNISKLAIIAESSYNSNRKIDDIINIVSEYVEYEVELVLDILLYETSEHKLSKLFVQQLYALAEKLKLIALFMDNKEVTKKVYNDLLDILSLVQISNQSEKINNVINYGKKKILNYFGDEKNGK